MRYLIIFLFFAISMYGATVIKDQEGTKLDIDDDVNAARIISVEHAEIHEGKHYHVSGYNSDIDTGTSGYWIIKTGASDVHMTIDYAASKNGLFQIYENVVVATQSGALTVYNSDRGSSETTTITFAEATSVTDPSDILYSQVVGTDATSPQGIQGGTQVRDHEFILKQSTSYGLKFTTETNDNRVSIGLHFYEN